MPKSTHKLIYEDFKKSHSATILPSLNFPKSAHITINSGLPIIYLTHLL